MCKVLAGCYREYTSGGGRPCPRDAFKKPDRITQVRTCPQHQAEAEDSHERETETKRAHLTGGHREDRAPITTSRNG